MTKINSKQITKRKVITKFSDNAIPLFSNFLACKIKNTHITFLGSFDLDIYNGARMVSSPLMEATYQPSNVVL